MENEFVALSDNIDLMEMYEQFVSFITNEKYGKPCFFKAVHLLQH